MQATCEICGAPFTTWPSWIKLGRGRFCSQECYGKYREGWSPLQKPRKRSETPLQRVAKKCAWCGDEFLTFPSKEKRLIGLVRGSLTE